MARSGDMDITWNQRTLDGILRQPRVVEATRQVAEQGLALVQAAAPVDSGDYRDGFRVERRESRFRTVWRIVGRDRKTMLLESQQGIIVRAMKRLKRRG